MTQMSSCRTWSALCSRWACTCVGGVRQSVGLQHDIARIWQAGSVGLGCSDGHLSCAAAAACCYHLVHWTRQYVIYMLYKLSLVLPLCRFGRRRSGCAPPACRAAARSGCRRWRQSRQESWGKELLTEKSRAGPEGEWRGAHKAWAKGRRPALVSGFLAASMQHAAPGTWMSG